MTVQNFDNGREIVRSLRLTAASLGFSEMRIAPALETKGFSRLVEWLESGFAGHMDYFQNRLAAYRHPAGVMEGVRSIIVLTLPYPSSVTATHEKAEPITGRTARYTWLGQDYHDVIHAKLKLLAKQISEDSAGCRVRGVVDTAPLMEREFAQLAGIGWQAKNTLIINKFAGSYFFLACLLTDLDLPLDRPQETDHCGTCRRCIDACPTDAFPQPGLLDASRCISYLTIEHREPIPLELRAGIGDWVFGCDVCQEVCPWNQPKRLARLGTENPVGSESKDLCHLELAELFDLDDEQFRARFRKTPMWRVRRRGLLRNAAIVLGNCGDRSAIQPLAQGLNDAEPLVRGASVWALRKIGGEQAEEILAARREVEQDPQVLEEFSVEL